MSLFDVDKHSEDRGSPMPNTHDTVIAGAQKAHGTNSVNYTTDASPTLGGPSILGGNSRLIYSNTVQITPDGINNTTTNTSAHNLGFFPKMDWGINHANIGSLTNVDIVAPPIISFSVDNGAGTITVKKLILASVDATNAYFQLFDATLSTAPVFITYYLYQQTAQ